MSKHAAEMLSRDKEIACFMVYFSAKIAERAND